MNITVIGLGYVGLVNAVVLASYDHKVIGLDIDKNKVSLLKEGVATIEEPNLQTLLTEAKFNLRFTTNVRDAIRPNNIFLIAVGTPPNDQDGSPDLTAFYQVLDSIASEASRDSFVIIRSTVPIGTNRKTKIYLESRSKYKFEIISFPEFLSQGRAVYDILNPSRIVVGVSSPEAEGVIREYLSDFITRKIDVILTSPENAELIKYASNSFLALKISFINSMARLAEKVGANIEQVAYGMSKDPRIGSAFLKAGLGYGGACLPKDARALEYIGEKQNSELLLIKAMTQINMTQPEFFLEKIYRRYKSLNNLTIAVLGVGYKGGTEDIRSSPAIPVVRALLDKNANIQLYDPLAEDNFHKAFSRFGRIKYCDYAVDALKKADFAVILNDSKEFKLLTNEDFIKNLKEPVVFDGRNLYSLDKMSGVEYHSIGRKTINKLVKY